MFRSLPDDDIIIADPEGEYYPLVNRLGGQVVRLSPSATAGTFINPMDINPNYADDEDPLSLKSDFILSLCELIVGGRSGLAPVEKTVIDRCVRTIYRPYLADPAPERMPILQDLYDELLKQSEPEARRVASALELYCTGSLNLFNHRTNVQVNSRLLDALKKERRELAERKKKLYAQYRAAQQEMREAVAVKANVDHLLGLSDGRENKAQER